MQIAIVGTGHVGLVTGACFAEMGHRVTCADNDAGKIGALRQRRMPFYEPGMEELVLRNVDAGRLDFTTDIGQAVDPAEVVFICVGTPQGAGGAADLSYIETVSREIAGHIRGYKVIVEKSTVPVQTGVRLQACIERWLKTPADFDVASNPEFLREGSAIQDALKPDRIVLGVASERAREVLTRLYAPYNANLLITDIQSAELIKHASNSFLAMKISYINAIAAICEATGADVEMVARGMGLDTRINRAFLNAGLGYGGYCFPKDVEAFIRIGQDLNYDFGLLREVQRINLDQRERLVRKIEKEMWVVKGKPIAQLGISYKPDTDDIRESPAIAIARMLVERGAVLRIYDPQAMDHARHSLEGAVFVADPYEAVRGADCLVIATEWREFRELDLARVKSLMAQPTVVDGRNLFDPAKMKALGFTYRCVGRA